MRIIRSVRHKVCVDGAFMREVVLSSPVSDEFLNYLKKFGPVMTLSDMGPGFFRFEINNGFSMKGWVGDDIMEIRFRQDVMDLCEDFVSVLFYYYHDGKPDLPKLLRMAEALKNNINVRRNGISSS